MQTIHFNTLDELTSWLTKEGYTSTKYFVTPDYVKSIIGIADDCKLVYSYDVMIEDLYQEYLENEEIDDAYTAAVEWIDYNTLDLRPRIAHIIFEPPYEGYNSLFEVEGLDEFMDPYLIYNLGLTDDDEIVFNAEGMTEKDINKIVEYFNNFDDIQAIFI